MPCASSTPCKNRASFTARRNSVACLVTRRLSSRDSRSHNANLAAIERIAADSVAFTTHPPVGGCRPNPHPRGMWEWCAMALEAGRQPR